MKKITTKYLRQNLKEIIDHVNDVGEEYMVYYRSKPAFKLVPEVGEELKIREKQKAFEQFKKYIKNKPVYRGNTDPQVDKENYRNYLRKKYEDLS